MVTAHTTDPEEFYTSETDSGYSVDNLAPAAPSGLLATIGAEYGIALQWDESMDEDFNYFRIHRSTDENYTINGPSKSIVRKQPYSFTTQFVVSLRR